MGHTALLHARRDTRGRQHWRQVAPEAIAAHTKVQITITNVQNPPSDVMQNDAGTIETWDSSNRDTAFPIDSSKLRTAQIYAGTTPLLSGADYGAYCPNSCSRHGVCRNFGKCTCYTRQGTDDA